LTADESKGGAQQKKTITMQDKQAGDNPANRTNVIKKWKQKNRLSSNEMNEI
jgi:hypothetical protein